MMPSVDGWLRTDRWDVSERAHNEYERTANTYDADAWLSGRKTMEEFASGRWKGRAHRNGRRLPRTDWVAPVKEGKTFAISLDPGGKLAWKSNEVEGDPLIEILGEDVPDGYLQFLRKKGRKFGIKQLMLEGGGETNGTFIHQGLVDELSLLVTPVADGAPGEPALFDVEGTRPKKAIARLRLKSVRKIPTGMVWLKYKVQQNGRRAA
jgi:dihydrofolate reductase